MRRVLCAVLLVGCNFGETVMDPDDPTPIEFEVPAGSTANGIGPALVEIGVIPGELQWKLYLRGADGSCLKAGRFEVRRDMSMEQVLETLCGVPLPDDVAFTVVEGWRLRDVDAALTGKGWIEAGEYVAIAESKEGVELPFEVTSPTLEGYLYPETYMVPAPPAFEAHHLIERQLATFEERFLEPHGDALGERTLHEVVVMASMVEREEPVPAQRPIVAGILWKRIDHGWQLGVDATSRYQLEDWNDRKGFLAKLRDPEDPYNTRIHKGLPPTAIGSPTMTALEASIDPEESEWWFYLHDKDGVFHGARNGDEHDANKRRYDIY